mgnify:CR=1 FL=1
MSTAQAHVTAAELAQLNKPKRSGQYWAGTIAGLAGIAFIFLRGTFNMDEMKSQQEQLKREQDAAKKSSGDKIKVQRPSR